MYFIYHFDGTRLLVNREEYAEKMATKEYFNTPKEARDFIEKQKTKLEKKEKDTEAKGKK